MPVQTVDVRDGDPTIQASGQHRGTVDVTFDDGRIITLHLRAPDLDGWNDAVAAAGATAQAQMEERDANDAPTVVPPRVGIGAPRVAGIPRHRRARRYGAGRAQSTPAGRALVQSAAARDAAGGAPRRPATVPVRVVGNRTSAAFGKREACPPLTRARATTARDSPLRGCPSRCS